LWGEAGTPPLTEKDLPVINNLYNTMIEETAKRPQTIDIHPFKNDIGRTYDAFLEAIGEGIPTTPEGQIRSKEG
jgi:hypothetical protein